MAWAVVFAFGLLLPARAGHVKMLHADESYNGRTVTLAAGEFLEISLAENPTTGYRWHLLEVATAGANPTCLPVKDSYEPGRARVAGQGGIHRWQFQAAESGSCTVELEYRRSWQKGTPPERTFRIHVEVRKGAQGSDPAKPSG